MRRDTVTLKFRRGGSQDQRLAQLRKLCQSLVADHVAAEAIPQPVFPSNSEPTLAAMFTVDVVDARPGISRRFDSLPDLEYVELAALRRSLARTGTR